MLQTRPSCLHTTDTTVVYTPQIHYRHDRRVQDGRVLVYVTDTTTARWRHTPTKLLPLTSPNPNPNLNTNANPNRNHNPNPTLTLNPNRTLTQTLINPTKLLHYRRNSLL